MPEPSAAADPRPLVALTGGDPAGIGPEILARAAASPTLAGECRMLLVADPQAIAEAAQLVGATLNLVEISSPEQLSGISPEAVPVWNPSRIAAAGVPRGEISADAGQAAYDYLIAAIDAALAGTVDAIVTAPLNKAALHAAGHNYPGHTELLAERTGAADHAMMLYLPAAKGAASAGFGVAHATLHTSIRSVPDLLSTPLIVGKIDLVQQFLLRVGCPAPRIGVCALNPHAGEEGLFGDEEARIIRPAVEAAAQRGIDVQGPIPADALMRRALHGEFDGVVAMYHDQGHIAVKLVAFDAAANVTLGLPIIRTSPSHGTAFDIAWQGVASSRGMEEAIRVAARMAGVRREA